MNHADLNVLSAATEAPLAQPIYTASHMAGFGESAGGEFLRRLCTISARLRAIAKREILSHLGLDMRDWVVLSGLLELGPSSQREIAVLTRLDKVAVNRAASRLKELDFVSMLPNDQDRRSHLLELSEEGLHALRSASVAIDAMEKRFLDGFGVEEINQLDHLLSRVESSVMDFEKSPGEFDMLGWVPSADTEAAKL